VLIATRAADQQFGWGIAECGRHGLVQVSPVLYPTVEQAFDAARPTLLEWRKKETLGPIEGLTREKLAQLARDRDQTALDWAIMQLTPIYYPAEYAAFLQDPANEQVAVKLLECHGVIERMIEANPYLLAEWGNP
jgi:hypothetical protein